MDNSKDGTHKPSQRQAALSLRIMILVLAGVVSLSTCLPASKLQSTPPSEAKLRLIEFYSPL